MAFGLCVLFLLCGINGRLTEAGGSSSSPSVQTRDKDGCCPKGWIQLDDHCFIFKNESMTCKDAENVCQQNGGYLVSIHSNLVNLAVVGLIEQGPAECAWIGLRDPAKDGNFQWTDGSTCKFDKFGYGNPGGHGLCVVINAAGEWFVKPCTTKKPYVCIRKARCCVNQEPKKKSP